MKNTIDDERKTIVIRWHALRQYQKSDVVGLRGYPEPNFDDEQRYELEFRDGMWRCDNFVADIGHGIGYDPIFRLVKQDPDLYVVIKACEEHAYTVYQNAQLAELEEPEWDD
jgi:hypothetical protein